MMRVGVLVVGLSALSACSVSAGQTARTAGRGNLQVGVEAGVLGVLDDDGDHVVLPASDFALRYGVTDRVDIGGRAGSSSLELQTKFQLTGDDGVIVSPAPSVQVVFVSLGVLGGGGYVAVPIPVLVEVPIGESALVLGPRLEPALSFYREGGETDRGVTLSGGGSVGYAVRVTDRIQLFPEVGVKAPILAAGGWTVDGGGLDLLWSARVNLLVGRTK